MIRVGQRLVVLLQYCERWNEVGKEILEVGRSVRILKYWSLSTISKTGILLYHLKIIGVEAHHTKEIENSS